MGRAARPHAQYRKNAASSPPFEPATRQQETPSATRTDAAHRPADHKSKNVAWDLKLNRRGPRARARRPGGAAPGRGRVPAPSRARGKRASGGTPGRGPGGPRVRPHDRRAPRAGRRAAGASAGALREPRRRAPARGPRSAARTRRRRVPASAPAGRRRRRPPPRRRGANVSTSGSTSRATPRRARRGRWSAANARGHRCDRHRGRRRRQRFGSGARLRSAP